MGTEISLAQKFFENHYNHRKRVREQCESDNKSLVKVRDDVVSVIVSHHQRIAGIQYKHEDNRMHLIAQLMTGLELAYVSIVEGLLAQAANLQKQQIEAITAIAEIERGRRKDGSTPNVKNSAPPGFYKQYQALNNAAHPSVAEMVEQLNHFEAGDKSGPTHAPQYYPEHARILLANHCIYTLNIWRNAARIFANTFGKESTREELDTINTAIQTLMEGGYIKLNNQR